MGNHFRPTKIIRTSMIIIDQDKRYTSLLFHLTVEPIASRDSVTRFSPSGFFHESVSPQAFEYTIRAISNFFENQGDIRSSRCTTGAVDIGGKWKKS